MRAHNIHNVLLVLVNGQLFLIMSDLGQLLKLHRYVIVGGGGGGGGGVVRGRRERWGAQKWRKELVRNHK